MGSVLLNMPLRQRVSISAVHSTDTTNKSSQCGTSCLLPIADYKPHCSFHIKYCTVQQVDLRQPTQSNARILVNLTGPMLEISSISVAYSKPWLLAVGADDSTLRIYDRRKLVLENQEIGGSGASGVRSCF